MITAQHIEQNQIVLEHYPGKGCDPMPTGCGVRPTRLGLVPLLFQLKCGGHWLHKTCPLQSTCECTTKLADRRSYGNVLPVALRLVDYLTCAVTGRVVDKRGASVDVYNRFASVDDTYAQQGRLRLTFSARRCELMAITTNEIREVSRQAPKGIKV